MKALVIVLGTLIIVEASAQKVESAFFIEGRYYYSSTALTTSYRGFATTPIRRNAGVTAGYVMKNGLAVFAGAAYMLPYYSFDYTRPGESPWHEQASVDAGLRWYIRLSERLYVFPALTYRHKFELIELPDRRLHEQYSSVLAGGGLSYFITRRLAVQINTSFAVLLEENYDAQLSAAYFFGGKQ